MAEVSIIVPIYNAEVSLPKCIDSILNQTIKDFELLLINDGSTDNSSYIIGEYAKRDKRIIAIHQKNKGVSAARNAGLRIAKGKYVGFVDSDDYIDETMYEKMITNMKMFEADMACCNWDASLEDGGKKTHCITSLSSVMSIEEFVCHLFDVPRTVGGGNCNKLFLKEKIKAFYDETISICEDNLFLMQYCLQIQTVCFVNEALYHIFESSNSATRGNPGKVVAGLSVRKQIIEVAEKISKKAKRLAQKDYLDSCFLLYRELDGKDPKASNEARECFVKYLKGNLGLVMVNREISWKIKAMYLCNLFLR